MGYSVHEAIGTKESTVQTDEGLIAEYQSTRSEQAFAEIVARHGAAIYRTCFRILGRAEEAEDAVQAVFLILSQRPRIVRRSLVGWLHSVARHTSLNVRKARARRVRREGAVAGKAAAPMTDVREELDAALARLPEGMREAVVLTYLEGRSQEAGARMAGCPVGTFGWRAMKGLDRLRAMLGATGASRQGAAVGGAALLALLAEEASAAAPNVAALAAGAPAASVTALASSVTKAMAWAKIKVAAVVTAGLVCAGALAPIAVRAVRPSGVEAVPTLLTGHSGAVLAVAFSLDGRFLASGGHEGGVRLWDVAARRLIRVVTTGGVCVTSLAFSPDGRRLAASSSDSREVRLWDVAGGSEPAVLTAESHVAALAFSPDGKRLGLGCSDGYVRLWDLESGRERAAVRGHGYVIHHVAFSSDGRLLASAGGDGKIGLWDAVDVLPRGMLKAQDSHVGPVAFAEGGRTLLATGWGGGTTNESLKVWDVATGTLRATLPGSTKALVGVAASPDGRRYLAASLDGTLFVWDAPTGRRVRALEGLSPEVRSATLSPDGLTLALGDEGGGVRLIDWSNAASLDSLRKE